MKVIHTSNLHVWAACLAAEWAQMIGLRVDNMWEPAIARVLAHRVETLGDDSNVRAFVEAQYRLQLGLPVHAKAED